MLDLVTSPVGISFELSHQDLLLLSVHASHRALLIRERFADRYLRCDRRILLLHCELWILLGLGWINRLLITGILLSLKIVFLDFLMGILILWRVFEIKQVCWMPQLWFLISNLHSLLKGIFFVIIIGISWHFSMLTLVLKLSGGYLGSVRVCILLRA